MAGGWRDDLSGLTEIQKVKLEHDTRVRELLAANNREVKRRRTAINTLEAIACRALEASRSGVTVEDLGELAREVVRQDVEAGKNCG